jgi:outer membrane protein assembly factor BamB
MARRITHILTALLVVGLSGFVLRSNGAAASTGTGDQAVAYQIDIAHSGGLSGDFLTPPLVKQWSRSDLGGTVSYPLIAGGKVFVTVQGPYGNSSYPPKWIYALDEATGTTAWSQSVGGTFGFISAAYDNGTVYVLNYDGLLQTFDATTGVPGWAVQLAGQHAFTSPPTAASGVIYVVGAGAGGTLYTINESNGATIWTQAINGGDHTSPALSSGSVFVSTSCDVYAFSRPGGQIDPNPLVFQKNYGCSGGGGKTPVFNADLLYVRNEGVPASNDILEPLKGGLQGHFNSGPAPAFSGSTGFFLNAGTLQAVDSTGGVVWSFVGDGGLDTAPIVVNSDVFVGSSSGNLYAIDVSTGQPVWNANVGTGIQAPDEQNANMQSGLSAGEGHLLVPAGSTLSAFVTAGSDTTPPTLTCSSPPTSWSASDVSIACTAADGGSGLANGNDASFSLTTSVPAGTETGTAATPGHSVCDKAGNCATAGPYTGIKVDKKGPVITIMVPSSGTYLLHATVAASYSCADGGSGTASCTGSIPNGASLDTSSVGAKSFIVNALDVAGNVAPTRSATYAVTYGICQPIVPTIKSGHMGNVSVQLCDAAGRNVSTSAATLTASGIYNSAGKLVQPLTNAFAFTASLNSAGSGYTEKVNAGGLSGGTYYIKFSATGDGLTHQATFAVR